MVPGTKKWPVVHTYNLEAQQAVTQDTVIQGNPTIVVREHSLPTISLFKVYITRTSHCFFAFHLFPKNFFFNPDSVFAEGFATGAGAGTGSGGVSFSSGGKALIPGVRFPLSLSF